LRESANGSPEFAAAFAHLLSVSPISAEKLKLDPSALEWLARPEIAQSERGPRRMRADFDRLRAESSGEGFDERFRALRRWKAREMLRIALREVAGWSSVEQTTFELTLVAELCVQIVTRAWLEQLGHRRDFFVRRRRPRESAFQPSGILRATRRKNRRHFFRDRDGRRALPH